MACFMHLTPDETRQFEQAGRFLLQESSLTAGGKAFEDFLLNFSDGFSDMPVKKILLFQRAAC